MMYLLILFFSAYQAFAAQYNYKVDCENPKDCPQWFAGLIHSTGVCSSFLVQPDIMATNLHCLPDDLATAGADCNNKIEFIFPSSDSAEEERFACDRVLHLSPPLEKEIVRTDYAFLRLRKKSDRMPLSISQKGFPDLSRVNIYKMDPDPEAKNHSVIRRTQCVAVQNSIINPYFTTDTGPLVLLTSCQIIKGNSGSPLILDDGEAHGIVSATMDLPLTVELQTKIQRSKNEAGEKLSFAFGSNFSCLNNRDLGYYVEKTRDCDIEIDRVTQQKMADALIKGLIERVLKILQDKVNNHMQKDLLAGKPLVLWRAVDSRPSQENAVKGQLLKVSFEPHCLLPKTTNLKPYENRLAKNQVTMSQNVPEYRVLENLDEYLRYAVKLEEKNKTSPIKLVPQDLLKRVRIPVEFENRSLELDLCHQPALKKAPIDADKN